MILRDSYGLLVSENDSMDSAHFTSLAVLAGVQEPWKASLFVTDDEWKVVRHPYDKKSNNWKNATRDQMMPTIAALNKNGKHKVCRKIFWDTIKRFCFAQNTERDLPGSKKLFYPHWHWKDSKPELYSLPFWHYSKISLLKRIAALFETKKYTLIFKWLDGPDPLFPHYIFMMLAAGWPKHKTIARVLAFPWFVGECLIYRFGSNDDQGALISCAHTLSFLKLYKRLVPNWEAKCDSYFNPRGLAKLGEAVKGWLKDA